MFFQGTVCCVFLRNDVSRHLEETLVVKKKNQKFIAISTLYSEFFSHFFFKKKSFI